MNDLIAEEALPVHQAGFLAAMKARGATAEELAGFVDHLRSQQVEISVDQENLIDLCGTGGGRSTLNLSTGASFLAAAAGAKVAKHGNRAVTSACGSSDLLESLGISLSSDPDYIKRCLRSTGIGFFFAPAFHPALKSIGPVRRELGVRTVFNQLGPLLNPARAGRQLIGVYLPELMRPMVDALLLLGCEEAFVVHSHDGLDEVSPCGKTAGFHLRQGAISPVIMSPEDFGFNALAESDIDAPANAGEAALRVERGISDARSKEFLAFLPNASVCLVLAGVAGDFQQAAKLVIQAVESGKARQILNDLRSINDNS